MQNAAQSVEAVVPQAADAGPHTLPGWTRLCYSELTSGGLPLNWDWSQEEVRALAQRARRVRIQSRGSPEEAVVSRPGAYPIENIREGNPIGFGRELGEGEIGLFWESPSALLLARLLHVGDCWRDHGHKEEVCRLETNVYWAACNGQGLHWHGSVHGGHLPPTCSWNNNDDTDLELYVDAEVDSDALGREAQVDVLVRDLSGTEVATLRVPVHETIGQLKKRLCGRCADSVYTQRLMHSSKDSALEDSLHMRKLPQPAELQLVRLQLDSQLGEQLLVPAFNGDVRTVEKMLRNCASPNEANNDGMTPLMMASQSGRPGHVQVVRSLCAAGAAKERKTVAGATALWLAAAIGHLEVVRFLVHEGADRTAAFENGANPLHVAAHHGHLEVVRFLCVAGEDLDGAMLDGGTSLQRASQSGHAKVVEFLCEAGADKDRADSAGWTALLLATHGGQLHIVRLLCTARADKEKTFRDGSTPLMMAATMGQREVLEYLCSDGAEKDAQRWDGATSLHMAAKVGHVDVVRRLCEAGADMGRALLNGMTPIFLASTHGHLEVAQVLHEAGAAVDVRTEAGATPLLLAAAGGHVELVRWLAQVGVPVDAAQLDGRTPLLMASEAGHLAVVRQLCEAGSNRDLADLNGWTPLLRATHSQRSEASPGLGFRCSKDLEDRAGDGAVAAWGATVIGADEGDGWLKVGSRYLPMVLQGIQVLAPIDLGG
uniref:Ubiquitin-like domain-containing protein n=1 Tax=Alexandrium monilatum TaxID=311494 RepID=A0A7S4R1R5_9DINO